MSPSTTITSPSSTSSTAPTASVPPGPSTPTDLPTTSPTKGALVTLNGIPEPGVEQGCLVLQGHLLIGGDRALLGSGKKVTVTARIAPDMASYCQQGVLVVVEKVVAAG